MTSIKAAMAMTVAVVLLAACQTQLPDFSGVTPTAYKAGDRFDYLNADDEPAYREVVAVEGDRFEWVTETGYRFTERRDIFLPNVAWDGRSSTGRLVDMKQTGSLWPLHRGNSMAVSVTYERTDKDDGGVRTFTEDWECQVNRPRWTSVPAGRYWTHKVICRRYDRKTGEENRTHIWYYADEVGHYIKRIKKYEDGDRKELYLTGWRRAPSS